MCYGTGLLMLAAVGILMLGVSRAAHADGQFPADVPVYPGLRNVAITERRGRTTGVGTTSASIDDVLAFYQKALPENGWAREGEPELKDERSSIISAKGDRKLMLGCWRRRNDTSVIIDIGPAVQPAEPADPGDPEARRTLEEMAAVYAACSSYRDKGAVDTLFIKEKPWSRKLPFATAFAKPDRFRFEFSDVVSVPQRYIVHADAAGVRTWWSIRPGMEQAESLELALAGATGVSGASAINIPALLFPNISCYRLTSLAGLELLPEEVVDGANCYHIKGKGPDGDPHSLWIDKSTKLLRKIYETTEFSDFRTETTTTYSPEINIEIEAKELEFNAPGGAAR